jgi:hypothetical protein
MKSYTPDSAYCEDSNCNFQPSDHHFDDAIEIRKLRKELKRIRKIYKNARRTTMPPGLSAALQESATFLMREVVKRWIQKL